MDIANEHLFAFPKHMHCYLVLSRCPSASEAQIDVRDISIIQVLDEN
jgi:hypothetical protein